MFRKKRILCLLLILLFSFNASSLFAANLSGSSDAPSIELSDDISETIVKEATIVRGELEVGAKKLFQREKFKWGIKTFSYLYEIGISIPSQIPIIAYSIKKHSSLLGMLGSLLVTIFIFGIIYAIFWRRKLLLTLESKFQPAQKQLPEKYHYLLSSALQILVSVILPLILFGIFHFIKALFDYEPPWFLFTGKILFLWVVGAAIIHFAKELLTNKNLFLSTEKYGHRIFWWVRLLTFYVLAVASAFYAAESFDARKDVLDLLGFFIYVSTFFFTSLLFLNKRKIFGLIPKRDNRIYNRTIHIISKFYYPVILSSLVSIVFWIVGYKKLGVFLLSKIWFTVSATGAILLINHLINRFVNIWIDRSAKNKQTVKELGKSIKTISLYATSLALIFVVLNLLGLFGHVERMLSFPIFELNDRIISFWIIIVSILVLLSFIFASRFILSYLDYKIYPALGIEPGLAYALNTFFKYILIGIGVFISISIMGINLRFLLVFAGAIGIGIGFGLQSIAANIISGFTIIFGNKIRKHDWIKTADGTLGYISDIHLQATKLKSRDNVEYLIPNSYLMNNTIVNYSLSSPLVRLKLPVGVSYKSDPSIVKEILLNAAKEEELIVSSKDPVVWFSEYANSSINFELLFWIDIRKIAESEIKSSLYFRIFKMFKERGIEIPFPQRDIHIKSKV